MDGNFAQRVKGWMENLVSAFERPKGDSSPSGFNRASHDGQPMAEPSIPTRPGSTASAPYQALRLKSGLSRMEMKQQNPPKQMQAWKESVLYNLVSLGGLFNTAAAAFSPQGPGGCDHNRLERCANCLTSAPYVYGGVHCMRSRRTLGGKAWGASLVGVGLASCTFHASSGSIRPACRRLDFWTIAASSNMMLRAVYPSCPAVFTALGLAAMPFRPFVVSFLNSTAMEVKYLHRAYENPELRKAHRVHAATCLLGLTCFVVEEVWPQVPLMHAAWHCLSAAAVASINPLVADVEVHELGLPKEPARRQIE